jgi:hypothetical protein
MERFVTRHHDRIAGILTGFDRMRFRGTLRSISNVKGLAIWLNQRHVLLKEFGAFAERLSKQLTAHGRAMAAERGRPFEYLSSWKIRKEDRAREIQARDGIRRGLIAVFECVEGCRSFRVRGNRQTKRLELVSQERRCAHLYFYYWDHDFGLMHVRLQTWVPFTMQICVNGREWLAQQLRRAGRPHTQVENCVFDIADLAHAQQLLRQLDTRPWARVLRAFATRVNPLLCGHHLRPYYWSLEESEYATDVLFRDRASLPALYPALVTHAFQHFRTPDVLRFLGRQAVARTAEVTTRIQRRVEGVRVKHWVAENSVKMYDKLGQILRVETTLNQPRRFKVYRATAPGEARHWVPLRKGIADIPRRVALAQATNARYLDALSVVAQPTPVHHVLDPVSRPRCVNDRPYRPLRPIAPDDSACFARLLDGRALLDGVHARDLREVLSPRPVSHPVDQRRLIGRVSRLLRLYRAHGLIAKVAHTRLYRVTPKGHQVMTAALACRAATLEQLVAA